MAYFGAPKSPAIEVSFFFMMTVPQLPFDLWKLCLREDCVLQDKLLAFESFGDEYLKLVWESGALPYMGDVIQKQKMAS
jgi:hypothetical protein